MTMKHSLFLDSSVFVAALISSAGGSFRICRESSAGNLETHVTRYVLDEVASVIGRKYPALLNRIPYLLSWANVNAHKNASAARVRKVLDLINREDAPILAGALRVNADFLATLDQKDFFTKRLAEAYLPLVIVTPRTFFQQYWKQ